MPLIQTTSPRMNGIDGENEVLSLKPVDEALMSLAENEGCFVSEPASADINWVTLGATPIRPSNDQPFAGGRTFRFDDDLQDEAPIYFRVFYGSGSTNTAGVHIQVGTGMNADGTLTGNICTRKVLSLGVADNNPYPVWISGGPNFVTFVIVGRTVGSEATAVFVLERMRDAEGNETAEGAVLLSHGNGGAGAYPGRLQIIPAKATFPVPADVFGENHIPPIAGMSGVFTSATDLILAPIMVPFNGKWRYMKALAYRWADIAHGTVFDLDYLGDSKQYIALGNLAGSRWTRPYSTTGIAVRWE